MDDKKANIDLVFRNGLKDYEVLPPPEVWNNIRPVVRKEQQPVIILRAAATVAVILSLSFLAYRWSREISAGLDNVILTESQESEAPVNNTPEALPPSNPERTGSTQFIAQASVPVLPQENAGLPEDYPNTIQNIAFKPESDRISSNNTESVRPDLLGLIKYGDSKVSIGNTEALYEPDIPVKGESNRWTIRALVSPTYYTNFYSGKDELGAVLMSEEQPVFSYSGGVALSYKINKRFSVQSGLYYSSFGQELSGITSFGGFQQYDFTKGDHNFKVLTANGVVYTNNADIFLLDTRTDTRIITRYSNDIFDPAKANLEYLDNDLRQNFSYLELPVVVRYKIVDKTIDFNIIGGLSSNVLVNNSVYAALDGSKYQVGKTENLNLITFSSSLGMGMEYNFSDNLSLNMEPTLRYYLNPFNQIAGLRIHPYSFGIFSGISYRF